ncbi:MAG: hypothetical protein CSA31_02945 [Desulfobulbus propionicus]|nr:MAG: hypothetical protein CSA31_02945 [Desulfobulbus propionicus]
MPQSSMAERINSFVSVAVAIEREMDSFDYPICKPIEVRKGKQRSDSSFDNWCLYWYSDQPTM